MIAYAKAPGRSHGLLRGTQRLASENGSWRCDWRMAVRYGHSAQHDHAGSCGDHPAVASRGSEAQAVIPGKPRRRLQVRHHPVLQPGPGLDGAQHGQRRLDLLVELASAL
jgi:hypothetical protein